MRRLVALVSTAMLLLTGVQAAGAGIAGFDDVGGQTFYAKPVQWMVDEGITNGTGPCQFSPQRVLTRGEGAAFVRRFEGAKNPRESHGFVDIEASWQHGPISWLRQKGYVTGVSPTRFLPDDPMTRAEFAVLLWRVAGEPDVRGAFPFTDVTQSWQVDAVAWMAKRGITTGTSPTRFSPDAPLTRAQAATFLYRFAGSPSVSLDATNCGGGSGGGNGNAGNNARSGSGGGGGTGGGIDFPSLPTAGDVQTPTGSLGPRTTTAVNPANVAGIVRTGNIWKMERDWDETRDGGFLDFGEGSLDVNGRTVEGFVIEVPEGLGAGHVIDGGGTVGYFEITNPDRHSHNSYIRVIDRAHHYTATGVVGDAIKVPEGYAHHHDAVIIMDVRPGGPNDKHYDGAQVFANGSARLERIVIDGNGAGTIANTTGALFTQDNGALVACDILILDPGGTWQTIRLSGSGHHDVARIQVVGSRGANAGNGSLAPTALVKITNGSGTFNLINNVTGAADWLIE